VISGIKSVVLDTNALLMPFQFNINLDHEIRQLLGDVEVLVPSCVIAELKKLKVKESGAALSLAGKYKEVSTSRRGDEGVVEAAKEHRAAVVTNDQELISILRKLSIPVIRMRECQRLDFA